MKKNTVKGIVMAAGMTAMIAAPAMTALAANGNSSSVKMSVDEVASLKSVIDVTVPTSLAFAVAVDTDTAKAASGVKVIVGGKDTSGKVAAKFVNRSKDGAGSFIDAKIKGVQLDTTNEFSNSAWELTTTDPGAVTGDKNKLYVEVAGAKLEDGTPFTFTTPETLAAPTGGATEKPTEVALTVKAGGTNGDYAAGNTLNNDVQMDEADAFVLTWDISL